MRKETRVGMKGVVEKYGEAVCERKDRWVRVKTERERGLR